MGTSLLVDGDGIGVSMLVHQLGQFDMIGNFDPTTGRHLEVPPPATWRRPAQGRSSR
jgi:hypothetical protein